jgi:hypothetical protein
MDWNNKKRTTTDEGEQGLKRVKRSTELKLNEKKLVWKEYETKLPRPQGTTESIMHEFIQRLEKNSQPPNL